MANQTTYTYRELQTELKMFRDELGYVLEIKLNASAVELAFEWDRITDLIEESEEEEEEEEIRYKKFRDSNMEIDEKYKIEEKELGEEDDEPEGTSADLNIFDDMKNYWINWEKSFQKAKVKIMEIKSIIYTEKHSMFDEEYIIKRVGDNLFLESRLLDYKCLWSIENRDEIVKKIEKKIIDEYDKKTNMTKRRI